MVALVRVRTTLASSDADACRTIRRIPRRCLRAVGSRPPSAARSGPARQGESSPVLQLLAGLAPMSCERRFRKRRAAVRDIVGLAARAPRPLFVRGNDQYGDVRRALLVAGIVAPLVKVSGVIVASRAHPGYSHTTQAISELSARDAPGASIHRATTVANGLLQLGFAYGLLRRRQHVLACTFTTVGIAAIGAAAFPCSPGCPPPGSAGATRSDAVHNLFGFAGAAALIAAPTFGLVLPDTGHTYQRVTMALAPATILTGAAALGGLSGSRKGLWQRAFQLSSHTWQLMAASHLLTSKTEPPSPRT